MEKIMFRKLLVTLLGLAFLGVFAVAEADEKMKVLYHLNELEKAYWVLDLIRDHVNVVGTDNVDIVLVIHGPALKAFHKENGPIEVNSLVGELQVEGVKFDVCGVTMRALDFSSSDLLPDFVRRDEGGTVRIAELQSKGYIYIRP
jgi:hypothetical protein